MTTPLSWRDSAPISSFRVFVPNVSDSITLSLAASKEAW